MKKIFILLLLSTAIFANNPIKKEKLVMIFTHMEGCGWCERMLKETFDDNEALKELKKNFMLAKIKKESGNMPSFLQPSLFPTIYILSNDGSKTIEKIEGYMKKNKFLKYTKTLYEIETEPDDDLED